MAVPMRREPTLWHNAVIGAANAARAALQAVCAALTWGRAGGAN